MRRALALLAWTLVLPAPVTGQSSPTELLGAGRAAAAVGDHAEAYRLFRQAYDPIADDPRVLSAMAGAAASAGELPRFLALLDSVVSIGTGYRHALAYRAALTLDRGGPPESVVPSLEAYLVAHPDDVVAPETFTAVLLAHGAAAEALGLLQRAERRGARPEALALPLGDARRALGDGGGAVEAWAQAVALGDERGSDRIRGLLAAWPSGSTPVAAVAPLSRMRARAEPRVRAEIVTLLAEALIAAGEGDRALETARDRALDLESRVVALRAVAERARAGEDLATARRAIEALVALGAADRADRALLAEIDRSPGPSGEFGRIAGVDPRLAPGDAALARARPDSAIAAYAAAVDPAARTILDPGAIEALARIRLVRALVAAGAPPRALAGLGATLLSAGGDPSRAAVRLDSLAAALALPDSASGAALLAALAAEWRGRGGDPAGASAALEAAAERAGSETPSLLLAAGRWAAASRDRERARELWRRLVERYGETPYALEARRLLADATGGGG